MLETLAIILIVLWAFGFIGGWIAGPIVHLLLVVALVLIVLRLTRGRRLT